MSTAVEMMLWYYYTVPNGKLSGLKHQLWKNYSADYPDQQEQRFWTEVLLLILAKQVQSS